MSTRKSSKKITRVASASPASENVFQVDETHRKKARNFRILAFALWLVAIGFEVFAILLLNKAPVNTTLLFVYIAADFICAVSAGLLWKKANRWDPPSKKDKFKFFIQTQLGAIMNVIAFLPLVIFILKSKNLDVKTKKLVGGIAVVALLSATALGVDYNPPSQEEYLEQTEEVKALNGGKDFVYWTKSGSSYHLFEDCFYINSDRTTEIFEGTVADARTLKNITDLCNYCESRSKKALEETE
ncbi:hypothetical protein N8873_05435 [Flavobacteriaceae bacterium]|nr:hypothetical protein [Flavobacteriaceae bacterium]